MKFSTAIVISILLHIGLIALLISNFHFKKIEIKQSGNPTPQIQAQAVNSKKVEQLVEKLKQEKLAEKKRLDDLKKAQEQAKKKRQEEERKAEEARKRKKKAEEKRKAEEKKALALKKKREKEEKEKKKKVEQERKRKAEEERKRKEKEEADRKRKAKEEEDRKRKEAEEKARQDALEREMMAQMEAEAAELAAAKRQQVLTEVDKYVLLIQNKIKRNWIEPEQKGHCLFKVQVSSGGLVLGVSVIEGNPQHCDSGQRAIYKSEPLPVSKDPDVFSELKNINLTLGERNNNG